MIGPILLPEQPRTFKTSQGFVLNIDLHQNAIKGISHDRLDWQQHQDKILAEARNQYPGIEIWKKWTVTYASTTGAEESIEVTACRSDLPELFPNMIRAEEAA